MNIKKSKILAIALSAVFAVGSLSGCGNNNSTFETSTKDELDPEKIGYYSDLKLPITKDGTKIVALCDTSVTTSNDSVVIKELRKRTGIDVDILAVPRASIKQKVKVLLTSKDEMPDIFGGGLTDEECAEYGKQGAFEEILQYKSKLPNMKEIFYDETEKYGTEGKIKDILTGDGKLYNFPTFDVSRDVNHGFLYRKDIFDKNGIKMWHSPDEFLDVLRKLKKIYPDSTPFASKTKEGIFRDMSYNWGLTGTDPYYNEEEKVWKMSPVDPDYKKVLDLVKTMYDEKLIDPEFLTATQSAWTKIMTMPEKAFVTWDWIGRLDMFKEQTLDTYPQYDLRYAEPLNGKVRFLKNAFGGPAIKKSKNSLKAMQLCDYLISESGARLMTMGIEGVTYTMGEDGFAKYIGFEGKDHVDINELEDKYGMFISGFYRRFDRKSTYFDFSEREKEAQDLMNNKEEGYWPEDPTLSFNEEEKDVMTKYLPAFKKAAEEFSTIYVLSKDKTGDKAWNEWLKKAESLGASKIADAYNKAQERYNKL